LKNSYFSSSRLIDSMMDPLGASVGSHLAPKIAENSLGIPMGTAKSHLTLLFRPQERPQRHPKALHKPLEAPLYPTKLLYELHGSPRTPPGLPQNPSGPPWGPPGHPNGDPQQLQEKPRGLFIEAALDSKPQAMCVCVCVWKLLGQGPLAHHLRPGGMRVSD